MKAKNESQVDAPSSSSGRLQPYYSASTISAISSTPICKKCKQIFIAVDSLFCPYCGTPCIRNQVIREKSTEKFDPMNPLSKPWREPPPEIRLPNISGSFFNKKPWKPIMKHGSNPPSVGLKSKQLLKHRDAEAGVVGDTQYHELSELSKSENIDTFGKGIALTDDSGDSTSAETEPIGEWAGFVDKISPICLFPVDWLHPALSVTLHISLLERKRRLMPGKRTIIHPQYWLRVGVAVGEEEEDQSFIALDFIGNSVGRCLLGRTHDWVDFSMIDPTEYYVAEFLKRMLQPLARRVSLLPSDYTDQFDQWMIISYPSRLVAASQERSMVATWYAPPFGAPFASVLRTLLRGESSCDPLPSIADHEDYTFFFDKSVCEICCKLVVSTLSIEKSLLTKVRMSVAYGSCSPLQYPLPASLDDNMFASHIILQCTPLYSESTLGVRVDPKVVVLDAQSVDYIMSREIRPMKPSCIESKKLATSDPEKSYYSSQGMGYKCSIDVAIEVGGSLLEHLLRSILSHLKYESTNSGVQIVFPGAVHAVHQSNCDQTKVQILPWPDDETISHFASNNRRSSGVKQDISAHDKMTSFNKEHVGSRVNETVKKVAEKDSIYQMSNSLEDASLDCQEADRAIVKPQYGASTPVDLKVNELRSSPIDESSLATRKFAKGALLSFSGKFAATDDYGVTLGVEVRAAGFPSASVEFESKFVQYFVCSLDPPYQFEGSEDNLSEEEELDLVWRTLLIDESLQHRVFVCACDYVDVFLSREKKSLDVSHSLEELDLC